MAFQLNKSSIPLFALLILSLYSSASAVSSGTASYSEPLYIPSACYEHQDKGVMIAAEVEDYITVVLLWDKRRRPSLSGRWMTIAMITDFCPSASCDTLSLSKEAFAAIADLDAGVINIAFQL
ncbi:hypothetical protein ACOSP7_030917 [Xanthoceras sorbifolium]